MFDSCHIRFWQPSNFVGGSLEVTRTIRNNKPHFTWGCSILLLKKKRRGPWDRIPFFLFQWFWYFFFSILIQIITYLTTHYSQNVFRGFSILVYIGVQVFFRGFFFSLLLSHVTRSRARLALASVSPKNAKNCACSAEPGLLNETKGSWLPLSCLSSYQNGW